VIIMPCLIPATLIHEFISLKKHTLSFTKLNSVNYRLQTGDHNELEVSKPVHSEKQVAASAQLWNGSVEEEQSSMAAKSCLGSRGFER